MNCSGSVSFPLWSLPSCSPSPVPRGPSWYESSLPAPLCAKNCAKTWLSAPGLWLSLVTWYPDPRDWLRPHFCPENKAADVSTRLQGLMHPVSRVIRLFIHSFVRMPGPWRAGLSYWASRLCLGMLLNRTLGSYLQPRTFTPSHADPRETKREEWKSAELVVSFLFLKKDLCGMCVHIQMCFCLILIWHLYND